jgi:hypothetical protein
VRASRDGSGSVSSSTHTIRFVGGTLEVLAHPLPIQVALIELAHDRWRVDCEIQSENIDGLLSNDRAL